MRCPVCGKVFYSRTCPHCGSSTQPTSQQTPEDLPPSPESDTEERRCVKKSKRRKVGNQLMVLSIFLLFAQIFGSYVGYEMADDQGVSFVTRISEKLPVWVAVTAILFIIGFILYLCGKSTTDKRSASADTPHTEQAQTTPAAPSKTPVLYALFTDLTPGKIIVIVFLAFAIAMLLLAMLTAFH